MKLLTGILAAALTGVAALPAANAADMYAGGYKGGPAYVGVNWSGLYVGVNGGYGSSENAYPTDPTGAFGGGQIGYNFQRGNVVFGVEADIQGSAAVETAPIAEVALPATRRWTGSAAFAGASVTPSTAPSSMGLAVSAMGRSRTTATPRFRLAGSPGGGLEYKLTPAGPPRLNISISTSARATPSGRLTDSLTGNRTQFSTFRVGVNYFIGGGSIR